MRKRFLYLFIFLFFFQLKSAFAISSSYDVSVCSSQYGNCMYTDINDALSDIEDGVFSDVMDDLDLFLAPGQYTLTKDYEFNADFYINYYSNQYEDVEYYDPFDYSIDGDNHTLKLYSYIDFYGDSISISNLNFKHLSNSPITLVEFYSNSFELENVTISSRYNNDFTKNNNGIYSEAHEATLNNVTIDNFSTGIYFYYYFEHSESSLHRIDDDSLELFHSHMKKNNIRISSSPADAFIPSISIDSCDLSNNLLSLNGYMNGTVSNTKLSNVFLDGFYSSGNPARNIGEAYLKFEGNNDYGDKKIRLINSVEDNPYYHHIYIQDMIRNAGNDFLYFVSSPGANIDLFVDSKESYNIVKTEEVLLTDCFIHIDKDDYSLFTFSVSDPSVAVLENGKVVFLKAGEVDVTAINNRTNEVYTVHFSLTNPVNPKTINSLYIMFVVLLFMISSIYAVRLRKRNN